MFLIAPFAIIGIVLFMALGGWVVMRLWNWLLPALFGWRTITFWQAIAMLVLCRILFGGVSGRGWHRRYSGRRMAGRWGHMTPEEREKISRRDAQPSGATGRKWAKGTRPESLSSHSSLPVADLGGRCGYPSAWRKITEVR